jgi:hypothetical protein
MRAFDYIRELPGGIRFVSRETQAVMFVTCAEDGFHHVGNNDLFNVTTGKIEEAAIHFPSSWSKKMLLDKFDLEVPLAAIVGNATIVTQPRKGDESPPDPTENPKAYGK